MAVEAGHAVVLGLVSGDASEFISKLSLPKKTVHAALEVVSLVSVSCAR